MQIVATRNIHGRTESEPIFQEFVKRSLDRFFECDWGDVDEHDEIQNNYSLEDGTRIIAAYKLPEGIQGPDNSIWIILEADRSATTVLWPSEY